MILKTNKKKKFFIFLSCFLFFYYALFSLIKIDIKFLPKKQLSLGLDLKGGSVVVLSVDLDSYFSNMMLSFVDDVNYSFKKIKLKHRGIGIIAEDPKSFAIKIGEESVEKAKNELKNLNKELDCNFNNEDKIICSVRKNYIKNTSGMVVIETIKNIRNRIDSVGTKDVSVQKKGKDKILIQVPNTENIEQVKSIISRTAKLSFHLLVDESERKTKSIASLLKVYDEGGNYYWVKRNSELDGYLLKNAMASYSKTQSNPSVHFVFNSIGAKKFAKITKENVGKSLAIVIDNVLLTAPVIQGPIVSGSGEISGNFTVKSANNLAIMLRSGALPASVKVVEEKNIGATLGVDAIESGKKAVIFSLCIILVFMFLIYGMFGLCAGIALIINLSVIISVVLFMQIALTLPGIAGIALTIGMAVDANIIIFERIIEERKKYKIAKAIENSFEYSIGTIIDSNITTLIAAIILFFVGSGPIQGFALTFSVGIISSIFTTTVVTKELIALFVNSLNIKKVFLG